MITTGIIDKDKHKPFNDVTALDYIEGHQGVISRFLNEKIRKRDQDYVLKNLLEFPTFFANLVKMNYEMPEEKRIQKIFDKILNEGMITIILGGKRQGKTAVTTWLMEQLESYGKGKKIYWYGFSPVMAKYFPKVIQTMNLKELEDGVLIYDETMLTFLGRDAMTADAKDKVKMLPTIGHRNMSIIFLTQTTRIDAIILNLANSFWFKPYSSLDFDKERGGQKKLFYLLRYFLPKQKFENTFFDMDTNETYMFKNPLPQRWDDALSKPFSLIKNKKEAKKFYQMMVDAKLSDREIKIFLSQRGWDEFDLI